MLSSCRGLWPHGGSNKDSVFPVERLVDQRDSWKHQHFIILNAKLTPQKTLNLFLKMWNVWKFFHIKQSLWLIIEKLSMCLKWKQYQPSGLLPPKIMASMGTPSSLSHWGSMMGHWPAGAQKRELGWAHGVELPLWGNNSLFYSRCFVNIWISWWYNGTSCYCFSITQDGSVNTTAAQFTSLMLFWFIQKAKSLRYK